MKKMKIWSIWMLLLSVFPISLKAQHGFSFNLVLNDQFYAAERNDNHQRGILKKDFDPDLLLDYSKEELRSLIIVPVSYDDIVTVPLFRQGGQRSSDIVFCAKSGKKNTLYETSGMRLTEELDVNVAWMSYVSGANLRMLGLGRSDGKGYDLRIIFEQPVYEVFTTLTGPFDFSSYETVSVNGRDYYYINAKVLGKDEYVKYDVLGNKLTTSDFSNLAEYYNKLGTEKWNKYKRMSSDEKRTDLAIKTLFEAASVGNAPALCTIVNGFYLGDHFDLICSWAFGTASAVKCGEPLYYAGKCYFEAKGRPLMISMAKYAFNTAKEYGYGPASEELEKIANIEKPITLKGGPQPEIDIIKMDPDEIERLAKEGYLEAICQYCHLRTFFYFGELIPIYFEEADVTVSHEKTVDDALAVDVLPLLLAAAPKDANCQLILACIYAGSEALGYARNYTYSFRNPEKAKYWIEKFCSNPGKNDAHAWGYPKEYVDMIIQNIRNMSK